jgi:hypothetical protein
VVEVLVVGLISNFREPRLEIPVLLEVVREAPCMLRVPGICKSGHPDYPSMACHSNEYCHGKGKGQKSHDPFVAAGCKPCHDYLDGDRDPNRWDIMRLGRDRTLYWLFVNNKLAVKR